MLPFREKRIRGTEDFPFEHVNEKIKNYIVESHWHPEIELTYVVSGKVTVNVSEERYVLKPGMILFINPEELHSYAPYEKEAEYQAAIFSAALFQFEGTHYFEQNFTIPITNGALRFPRMLDESHMAYQKIRPVVHRIFYQDIHSKAMIFSDLITLFCIMMEQSLLEKVSTEVSYKNAEDVKMCIRYMEEHFQQKITLSELADLVHMSSNYFCSYFKRHTGVSPFTQLNYIRVKEAARSLLKSDDSVVAVAETCGFENVSFFIRKFKEIIGCTPSVYRKNKIGGTDL